MKMNERPPTGGRSGPEVLLLLPNFFDAVTVIFLEISGLNCPIILYMPDKLLLSHVYSL